jgi:hypothetical protein
VREHFGLKVRKEGETTYHPIIAMFGMMALMVAWAATGNWVSVLTFEWFIAFSMCALAIQKLQDVQQYTGSRRWMA